VKQPGRDVNHPRPPRTSVKNEWSYTFLVRFSDMDREKFTFHNDDDDDDDDNNNNNNDNNNNNNNRNICN
jgi:hypothetical protein